MEISFVPGSDRPRYDRLTRLPSLGLNTLRSALRARGAEELIQEQGEPKGRFHGTLDPEPGLLYGPGSSNISLTTLVRSMQITLGGGLVGGSPTDLTVNLDTEDLVQPLIGLNANGAPAVNTSLRKLMVYHERGIGDAAVLGRGVLEKVSSGLTLETTAADISLHWASCISM